MRGSCACLRLGTDRHLPRNEQVNHVDEDDGAVPDHRELLARDPGAAVSWLIDPASSHLALHESGAARTWAAKIEVDGSAEAGLRVRRTVMLKVRDITAFRQVAIDAEPGADPAEVESSIAAAWNHAAQPHAPMRDIPGVSWSPVDIRVEHVPAAERWRRRGGPESGTGGQPT